MAERLLMADSKIEALRTKISIQIGKLDDMLDDDGHGSDCVLRCFSGDECVIDHACEICGDDE